MRRPHAKPDTAHRLRCATSRQLVFVGIATVVLLFALRAIPAFAQPLTITHLAGNARSGGFDGQGNAVELAGPHGLAIDEAGNLYVADTSSHTIRKFETATRTLTTLAGTAEQPGSADGTGSAARFKSPEGLATDGAGNLYVADTKNYTIRRIVLATGAVSTVAGLAESYGSADGVGASARFGNPVGIACDGAGHLFVGDAGNATIRLIESASGTVMTLAGAARKFGSADGIGSAARFSSPTGLALDGKGNLFIADRSGYTIRKLVIATRAVTTVAGQVEAEGSTDGPAYLAKFFDPYGVACDSAGHVYVTDSHGSRLRRIDLATGLVSTLCGPPQQGWIVGGNALEFPDQLLGVVFDGTGALYAADALPSASGAIRKIVVASGDVTTIVGTDWRGSADGTGAAAQFQFPWGVATDGSGNLYVSDPGNETIRKIVVSTGEVTTLAGTAGQWGGSADGTGPNARFWGPEGIAADDSGNVYVADNNNSTIRKIVAATGEVTTLAGRPGVLGWHDGTGTDALFGTPASIAYDGAGNLFVADDYYWLIRRIALATGEVSTLKVGDQWLSWNANALVSDRAGHLYVVDPATQSVFEFDLAGSTCTLRLIAGGDGTGGTADGTGSDARFSYPGGIAYDGAGSLYVSDCPSATIRKVVIATGVVTTVAATPNVYGNLDGTGAAVRLGGEGRLAMDAAGHLFIADPGNRAIRMSVPTLADVATIDMGTAPIGQPRQLDTTPRTATSWAWEEARVPTSSTAALSSAIIRNPTFTPDVPGLYEFQLTARNSTATNITRVLLNAYVPPTATVTGGGTFCGGQTATVQAALTGQAPWNLTWSDGLVQSGVNLSPVTRVVTPPSNTSYSVTSLSDANTAGTGFGSATVDVSGGTPPDGPAITAPSSITTATTGYLASVPFHAGSTYSWTAAGGTITAGQGTNEIVFAAYAQTGSVVLSVSERAPGACASATSTLSIPVVGGVRFYTLTPCRLIDTRGTGGPLSPGEMRTFPAAGRCGIPGTARVLALDTTILAPQASGYLALFAGDLTIPPTLGGSKNFAFTGGRVRSIFAEIPLAGDASGTLRALNESAAPVDLVLDVSGYFQ